MRVITRHSKLLYFRKHLPGWQFAALNATVRIEARLRGALSRFRGRSQEARSWRLVDRVAKLLASGSRLGGRAVLEIWRRPSKKPDEPDAEGRIPSKPRKRPDKLIEGRNGSRPPQTSKGRTLMSPQSHLARIVVLMACVGGLLGWTGKNSSILFADGLRYIDQAKRARRWPYLQRTLPLDRPPGLFPGDRRRPPGSRRRRPRRLATRCATGLDSGGRALLVIPLYLVALEMFGGSSAWLAVVLSFLVPITGHVMADTLSESLFLLFFTSGSLDLTPVPSPRGSVPLAPADRRVRGPGLLGPARGVYCLPAAMVATLALIPSPDELDPDYSGLDGGRRWRFLVIGPGLPDRADRRFQGGHLDQASRRKGFRNRCLARRHWRSSEKTRSTPT